MYAVSSPDHSASSPSGLLVNGPPVTMQLTRSLPSDEEHSMPNKPFSERDINEGPDGPENGGDNGDKDDFEDKVQDDKQHFEKLSKDLVDKHGKIEKDESA